ncbi:inhibitor of nuclear factor kappa-B kinase subunit alpha-like [Lytechinus variegatus]|uniref:inhibitor of nuclear factor kappa-B kinase subunit alpha-like n=1 Tax=Lytechinus variegatus TaxID=7654 RepID=UPI001BB12F16|nr:inhibitor of nuclear factor kappa-B kinase subunit alpha-like [Lytechinus variegatus]
MPSTRGDQWTYKKVLGSGSFGEVLLYQFGDTHQYMAVKKCKTVLQSDNLKRWRDEVDFMRELRHTHLVQGLPVPPGLEAIPSEPPCLAMEYCSRGDLRKKLSEMTNMCGLPESEVLLLAKHISSAMEYLHNHHKSIIHRDIKPENIMLQDQDGRTIYKLTDLGFAKDSKNQPAVSFVGTKEYMAPELYSQTEYTKTADYWSFGTVLSEAVTGNRPFMLSNLPVMKWHEIIANKAETHIGYYEDCTGKLDYASNLPQPHQLCRPLQETLEKLLALLLNGNSSRRGGSLKNDKPVFYHWIDAIFNCKIIHVRDMTDGTMSSFPTRSNDTVSDLKKTLNSVTKLPADHHILLLATGDRLVHESAILHDVFKNHQGDWIVYLYPKQIPIDDRNCFVSPQTPMTPMVSALMNAEHLQVSENGFKVMWKQTVHYCYQLIREAAARETGFLAFMTYNLRYKACMIQGCEEMKRCFHRLQAKAEFFLDSMKFDTQRYAHQVATGFSSAAFYDSLKQMEDRVKDITQEPEEEVAQIGKKVDETVTAIYEMQKNAERPKIVASLQETSKKCDACFKKFKEENKAKRRENMDILSIKTLIDQAFSQYCEYNRDIYKKMREVQYSCLRIDEVMENMQDCVRRMEESQTFVLSQQKKKQDNMWNVLNVTVMKKKESEAQMQRQLSRSRSLVGPSTPPSAGSSGGGGGGGVPQGPIFDPPGDMEESMSILNESMQIQSDFDTEFNSLTTEQRQLKEELRGFDWTHLE